MLYEKNIDLVSCDEGIETLPLINLSETISQMKAFDVIDNVPQKQIEIIQKQLNNYSSMNQTDIQELSTKLHNIQDVNNNLNQYKQELMNHRKIYHNVLLKMIDKIKSSKNNEYIRWHDMGNKYFDYYGNLLSMTTYEGHIKIKDNYSNFFNFPSVCINENKTINSCYTKLPSIIYDADHSTIFKTYRGVGIFFPKLFHVAFVGQNETEIKQIGQEMKTIIEKFKNHINKYANAIFSYCESPYIFGYDDVQICQNEVYEPINNLDY